MFACALQVLTANLNLLTEFLALYQEEQQLQLEQCLSRIFALLQQELYFTYTGTLDSKNLCRVQKRSRKTSPKTVKPEREQCDVASGHIIDIK